MTESSRSSGETPRTTTEVTESQPESVLESFSYEAAIEYLYARINYEKIGLAAYTSKNYSLDRMRKLTDLLGNPQSQFPAIHVAGSKGKGTVSQLVAEILTRSGYRTGFFSSPHLLRLEERFRIGGDEISEQALVATVKKVRLAVDQLESQWPKLGGPTFFEITTAMGFLYFAEQNVELAVIEVGLGGRLDSTNVCCPCLSVVTSISLDHQKQLGDTIGAIASEKAGIIRPRVPVVCSARHPDARSVVEQKCEKLESSLRLIDRDFSVEWCPAFHSPQANREMPTSRELQETKQSTAVHIAAADTVPTDTPPTDTLPADTALANTLPANTSAIDAQAADAETAETRVTETTQVTETLGTGAQVKWAPDDSLVRAGSLLKPDSKIHTFETRLLGRHQADNIGAAIACVETLRLQSWSIPESALRETLQTTQPTARLQMVGDSPIQILDTAHNPASIDAGIEALQAHLPARSLTTVFAASGDKDFRTMLRALVAVSKTIVLTQYLTNPRAVPVSELLAEVNDIDNCYVVSEAKLLQSSDPQSAGRVDCRIVVADSPQAAWDIALQCTERDGVVYVAGSFFLAAELLALWNERRQSIPG